VAVLDEAARAWFAENTPLDFLAIHAILEGKSEKARLTPDELKYVVGRAYFYTGQVHVDDLRQVTVCVITAGPPWKVLKHSRELVEFDLIRPGLWKARMKLPLYVLVASHLKVEPKNYPFLLFATGKKRKEFLRALVQEAGSVYLTLALELYPHEVTKEMLMSRKKKEEWTKEQAMVYMMEQVGPVQALQIMGPLVERIDMEKVWQAMRPKLLDQVDPDLIVRALETLPPDSQNRLIEALIERLGPEEFEAHLRTRQAAA
jgi:hypothetical protein